MKSPSTHISALASLLHMAWFGRLRRLARSPIYRCWWQRWRDCETILTGPLRGYRFPAPEVTARLGIAQLPLQRWLLQRLQPQETVYLCQDRLGLLSLLAAERVGPQGNVYGVVSRPRDLPRLAELRSANQIENLHFVPVELASEMGGEEASPLGWAPPKVSLDSLAHNLPPPDLVYLALGDDRPVSPTPTIPAIPFKGERVFTGAAQLLTTRPPHTWIVESSSRVELEYVAHRLREVGYQVSSPSWPAPLLALRPAPHP